MIGLVWRHIMMRCLVEVNEHHGQHELYYILLIMENVHGAWCKLEHRKHRKVLNFLINEWTHQWIAVFDRNEFIDSEKTLEITDRKQ